MELVELHVGQLGAGLGSEGDSVAGGYCGIGGVGVNLACAAGGDEHGAGCNCAYVASARLALAASQVDADYAAALGDKAGDHGPLGKADALVGAGQSRRASG